MRCSRNCNCHLCRELANGVYGKPKYGRSKSCDTIENNFILRERPDQRYKCVVKVPGPSSTSTLDVEFKRLR